MKHTIFATHFVTHIHQLYFASLLSDQSTADIVKSDKNN